MAAHAGAFCEGMALSEKAGLKQSDLLEVLSLGAMANPMFALKVCATGACVGCRDGFRSFVTLLVSSTGIRVAASAIRAHMQQHLAPQPTHESTGILMAISNLRIFT